MNKKLLILSLLFIAIFSLTSSFSSYANLENYSSIEDITLEMQSEDKVFIDITLDKTPYKEVFISITDKNGNLEYFDIKEGVGQRVNFAFTKKDKNKELLYLKLSGGVIGSKAFRFGEEVVKSTSSEIELRDQLDLETYLNNSYSKYEGKTPFNITYSVEVTDSGALTLWANSDLETLRNLSEKDNIREFLKLVQHKATLKIQNPISVTLYKDNGSKLISLSEESYSTELPKLKVKNLLNNELSTLVFENKSYNILYEIEGNLIKAYIQGNGIDEDYAKNSKVISDFLINNGFSDISVGIFFYNNLGVLENRTYYYGDDVSFESNYIPSEFSEDGKSIDHLVNEYEGVRYFDLYSEHIEDQLLLTGDNVEIRLSPSFLEEFLEEKNSIEFRLNGELSIDLNSIEDTKKNLFKPELRLVLTKTDDDSYTSKLKEIRFNTNDRLEIFYGFIDGSTKGDAAKIENGIKYINFGDDLSAVATQTQENYKREFIDLNNHWALDTIENLVVKGIINGKSPNKFEPESTITRAEFMALLLRNFRPRLKEMEDSSYIWYEPYMNEGESNNLFPFDNYDESKNITREEIAYILVRSLQKYDYDTTGPSSLFYDDTDSISMWARDEVSIARENKLLVGFLNNFNPKATATRAEAAQVIQNLLDYRER